MTEERPRSETGPVDSDRVCTHDALEEGTLAAALESTSAGLVVVEEGTVVFANAAVEAYLGHVPDALVGESVDAAFASPLAERVGTVTDADGERTVEWTDVAPPAADHDGSVSITLQRAGNRVVATITPVDPRAPMAHADEETFRSLVEGLENVALFVLDADGQIATWNQGAESLVGRGGEEAIGEHLSVLYPDERADDASDALTHARREGRYEAEGWHRRADGSKFWASTTVTSLSGEGERAAGAEGDTNGFAVVIRDASERKRIADERQLLAEVGHDIAEAETYAEGIETALAAVCERTQWAYGEAWTPAADGSALEQAASHAAERDLEPFQEASRTVTFPYGEGLPGRVWATKSREWIPDASTEPRTVFHRTDVAEEVGLRAALGVPITTDDRVVAVLTFFLQEHRDADEQLVEVVTDVAADLGGLMARKQAEDALERERALLGRIFATSPVGLLVTDADGDIKRANRQAGHIFGRADDDLTGHRFADLADAFRDVAGEAVGAEVLPVGRVLTTENAVENVELQFERGEETVWISVSAAPLVTDGTVERVIVAVEDITERKEREQTLRSFQEAIEHAGHSIYVTDTDGTIQYVNPTFEQMTGYATEEAVGRDPSILNSGEHDDDFFRDLWETILNGEVWTGEVVNERKSGERYVVNQTIAPILDESGDIERFVAVNDEITEQKQRERTLRRQRNSLERIQQIIESLRPINRELARVGTREDIDDLVCEHLTASEAYLFAWVGDYNPATGEITPREWAGIEEEFVRDLDLTLFEEEPAGPFERAVADREVQALQEVPTDPTFRDRRDRALKYGYQSEAAIPVVYGDTVLGVIGVYSARPDAFDKYERGLLRELGERIGHAINAAENKQLLHTDTVVELEFEVAGRDSPLAAVTDNLDCRTSLNNVTPASGAEHLCYVEIEGADPDAVVDALIEHDHVAHARVVEVYGETGLVEVALRTGPVTTLVEHGATIRSFEAEDGTATLLGETAPQSDVEAVITDVEASHDGTTFAAKRTLDREVTTMSKTAVEETLTERQREALVLAYHAGYFESPRNSTGEELADALGIAAPTFYQHVRNGVRKIIELLVDTDNLVPSR